MTYLSEMYTNVRRNDICFCGSGKKYKKCCLNKIEKCEKMYNELCSRKTDYLINSKLILERNL